MLLYRRYGLHMSLGSVHRYMKILSLHSLRKKAFRPQKKEAQTLPHTFPNALRQNFRASSPNQVWLTDITYLPCKDGMLYLSCIKDVYDKSIVAYSLSRKNDLALVMDTLEKASPYAQQGMLLHSDQGCQYLSLDYRRFLAEHGITGSMSRKATPYDNAPMESFFSILKNEELYLFPRYMPLAQMTTLVTSFIQYYNHSRPQWLLQKLPPCEFRERAFP